MPNYAQAAISVRQKKERGLEKVQAQAQAQAAEVKTRSVKGRQVQAAW